MSMYSKKCWNILWNIDGPSSFCLRNMVHSRRCYTLVAGTGKNIPVLELLSSFQTARIESEAQIWRTSVLAIHFVDCFGATSGDFCQIFRDFGAPPAGEGYILRTTYPYYASRAESPRERATYYALRIRIMYQALKAHPRELCTTHYVSVLCIKRRKPAGEGYGVRITYPYYVSSAEP